MEKFEKLDNEQKELVKYWIYKLDKHFKIGGIQSFIEKHLTPEPVIEVGKWYKGKNNACKKLLFFCTGFNNSSKPIGYGFDGNGDWCDLDDVTWTSEVTKATPEEVAQRLIEEAERRYKQGDTISYRNRGKAKIVGDIYFADECGIVAVLTDSKSTNPFYPLMDNGEWAEIIDEKAEIRESVARLEAELKELKSKL